MARTPTTAVTSASIPTGRSRVLTGETGSRDLPLLERLVQSRPSGAFLAKFAVGADEAARLGVVPAPRRRRQLQPSRSRPWATKDLKVGITGTSHVPAFAGILKSHPEWRIKIVAAFTGGSPDMPASADRVEKFAAGLYDRFGVEIVDSVEELLPKVDVVLLHSLDGRVHLAQATPVFKAGKRVFIDKPLASSVQDPGGWWSCRRKRARRCSALRPAAITDISQLERYKVGSRRDGVGRSRKYELSNLNIGESHVESLQSP